METPVKTVSIFVSSTFNDMQAERDHLNKFVVPHLEEELKPYGISVRIIDLRWGVNTMDENEDQRESTVLRVCLEAIDNNKPFFVALLGERYGWIPSKERWETVCKQLSPEKQTYIHPTEPKSVTELEILYGGINRSTVQPRSLFYFRSPGAYEGMTAGELKRYSDRYNNDPAEAHKKTALLAELKQNILNKCHTAGLPHTVKEYTPQWDTQTGTFTNLEPWGKQVATDLLREIKEELNLQESHKTIEKWEIEEQNILQQFIQNKTALFKGRENILNQATEFLLKSKEIHTIFTGKRGLFYSGFSGCGKSAIFSMLVQKLSTHPSHLILAHAAGISNRSASAETMLRRWIYQLSEQIGEEQPGIEHDRDLPHHFQQLILRAQLRGLEVMILIDSLDSFGKSPLLTDFSFIPPTVPFICTTLPGHPEKIVEANPHFILQDIELFSLHEANEVINSMMARHNKQLPKSVTQQILNIKSGDHFAYSSPLWLNLAVTVFLELDAADFHSIHQRAEQDDNDKIEGFLLDTAASLPGEADILFLKLMQVASKYFGTELTQYSLMYIGISENGLREKDLAVLVGEQFWDPLRFTFLRRWFRNFMDDSNHLRSWKFTHNRIKEALLLVKPEVIRIYRNNLLNYLKNLYTENDSLAAIELCPQVIRANDIQYVHQRYCQPYNQSLVLEIAEILLAGLTKSSYNFIKNFFDTYSKTYTNDFETKLIEHLFHKGKYKSFSKECELAIYLAQLYFDTFDDTDLYSGDDQALGKYFDMYAACADYFYQIEEYVQIRQMAEEATQIYETNLATDPGRIKMQGLRKAFTCRQYYIHTLFITNRLEEAEQEGDDMLNDFFTYNYHNHTSYLAGSDPFIPLSFRQEHTNIPEETVNKWLTETFDFLYTLFETYPPHPDEEVFIDFEYNIKAYIKEYCRLSKRMTLTSTRLTKYILDSTDTRWHTERYYLAEAIEKGIIPPPPPGPIEPIDESKIARISSISPGEDDDDDDEGITMEFDNFDDFQRAFSQTFGKEQYPETTESYSETQLLEMEKELDNTLASINISGINNNQSGDEETTEQLLEQCLTIADGWMNRGNKEKALALAEIAYKLNLPSILNTRKNLAIDRKKIKFLVRLGGMYQKAGLPQRKQQLFESYYQSIRRNLLHHSDSHDWQDILFELIDSYNENKQYKERVELEEDIFTLSFQLHYENSKGITGNIRDLSYFEKHALRLLSTYNQFNLIERASLLLDRWLTLKLEEYTDDLDSKPAEENIDHIFVIFSALYEPTLRMLAALPKDSLLRKQELILIRINEQYGYMDQSGTIRIPCIYKYGWAFSDGYATVCKDGKWGYIDRDNNELFHGFTFDYARPFKENVAIVEINETEYLISSRDDRKIKITGQDFLGCYSRGGLLRAFRFKQGGNPLVTFINHQGEQLIPYKYNKIRQLNQQVAVAMYWEDGDSYFGLLNAEGKEITPFKYEEIYPFGKNKLTPFTDPSGETGYLNRQGEEIVPPKYSDGGFFYEGRAKVAIPAGGITNNKWGFINELGEEVVSPQYNDVGDFHEGLAWVCKGATNSRHGFTDLKYGFINPKGEIVIPLQYDDAWSFLNGRAIVFQNGELIMIDKAGNKIGNF